MTDELESVNNPSATSTASAPPAEPQAPLNLIDPKLKARALKRLQGIVKGNGVKIDDVKLEDCQAQVYLFGARTFLKLAPKYGVRTEPGMNKTAELIINQDDFNRSLQTSVLQSRTEPVKRKSIVNYLFQRPDKGFGVKDQKVGFHELKRDFVTHEGCVTCQKLGKVQCQKCHATGVLTCALCQGRKQINCPQCRGSGKAPGTNHSHSCQKCRGDGKVMCHSCTGRGQVQCQTCAATGTLKCQKCAGTGWLSHLAHVEMEANIHFDFDRAVVPVEVARLVDAFGSRLVEKGDLEVVLRPQPDTSEEIVRESKALHEPDDMIFIDYTAKVPHGPIQFRLKDRIIPATLFGYHGKLIEAPSFLDDITRKGQQVLQEAAKGSGNVAEKIRRAAKYRLLCDIIIQAAGKARQRQVIEILTNRYPTGIGADKLLNLLILADKAIKMVTRKSRTYGLMTGLGIFAALGSFYFLLGGRDLAGSYGIAETGLVGIDAALILLGTFIATLSAQLFSLMSQKKALAGLAPPEFMTRMMPKLGKTGWWALFGAIAIWVGVIAVGVALQTQGMTASLPPWIADLLLPQDL